jgi:hypothetical protein
LGRRHTPVADFFFYVNDNCTTGNSKREAWLAARRVASICGYLGIQDVARKRRKASQMPGAWWAGAVASTDADGVYMRVSQGKWDKTKAFIQKMCKEAHACDGWLIWKALESRHQFILYVTRTYLYMVLYMKGFHLTIDGWRKGRNTKGWKYLSRKVQKQLENGTYEDLFEPKEVPEMVKVKPHLGLCNLPALTCLFEPEDAPKQLVGAKRVVKVV